MGRTRVRKEMDSEAKATLHCKGQAPKAKIQAPKKIQYPNLRFKMRHKPKRSTLNGVTAGCVRILRLEIIWSFELGILSLLTRASHLLSICPEIPWPLYEHRPSRTDLQNEECGSSRRWPASSDPGSL